MSDERKPFLIAGVDPSLRSTGIAVLKDGILLFAHVIRSDAKDLVQALRYISFEATVLLQNMDVVVIEQPQAYTSGKVDRNDVLKVAMVAGLFVDYGAQAVMVTPHQWKGNVPKAIHNERVVNSLTTGERGIVESVLPKSLRNNAVDAVGLARWYHQNKEYVK